MANNDDMTSDDIKGSMVLERERRKLIATEDRQQASEARFKDELAKALKDDATLNAIAKEVRDAVERSRRGDSWYKNRNEGFSGMGVKPEDL